jgi:hypothetical protein
VTICFCTMFSESSLPRAGDLITRRRQIVCTDRLSCTASSSRRRPRASAGAALG